MIGKSNAVLLALLLALPTAFLATAYIAAPAQAQPVYTAWLKIVTSAWNGTTSGGISPTQLAEKCFSKHNFRSSCYSGFRQA